MVLTSTANPRVKDVVGLRKPRERRASGRFVVEGRRELTRCLAAGGAVETVYWCGVLGGDPPAAARQGVELVEVSRPIFEKMSLREGPDGILGVAHDLPTSLDAIDLPADPLVLVATGIEKPGNLGTMIRSAAAAGAHAVVVADPVTDVVNPNVVRASQGALFDIPVGVAASADEAIAWLGARGVALVAADPDAALPYWDAPLDRAAGIVIGAEHAGLAPAWRAAATGIGIPMAGTPGVDSLNASAAAAVLLFDAARRRARPAE